MKSTLIVPTLNAGSAWQNWISAIENQSYQPDQVLIIDSCSTDKTVALSKKAGFEVLVISRKSFNHGGTRKLAANFSRADILIFMTQDAILASSNSLEKLLDSFNNPKIGAVYGRQLPHIGASFIEAHARIFNYPKNSRIVSELDIPKYGFRSASMSNSFAAYRREPYENVGGFPENTIFAEDSIVAAKMLLAGFETAYQAEATVHHSHSYTLIQEFKRYFDIGVFHTREKKLLQAFGSVSSEGKKYVISEILYLLKNAPYLLPKSLLSIFLKWLGYKLGLQEKRIPLEFKRHFSLHKNYWDNSN